LSDYTFQPWDKRKRKRKYPKSSRKALVAEADDVFSLFIRYRDDFTCFTCDAKGKFGMQCGHLISRTCYALRWDELNAHAQCRGCNYSHEHHPEVFTTKYIAKHGLPAYEKLYRVSQMTTKTSDRQLTGLILFYKQELRKRWGVEVLTRR
jgi:hypothetical protein